MRTHRGVISELDKANYKAMSFEQLLRCNASFIDVATRKEHLAFIANELRIKRSIASIRVRGYPQR